MPPFCPHFATLLKFSVPWIISLNFNFDVIIGKVPAAMSGIEIVDRGALPLPE